MIEIKEITDKQSFSPKKKVWEDFLLTSPVNSFFQSWTWGEVIGENLWRLGVYDDGKLIGIAQINKVTARRGTFLHVRHGPVLKEWKEEYFLELLKYFKILGKQEKAWFIRISPQVSKDQKEFFRKYGFRAAPIQGQDAELAWVLDLEKSTDQLLAGMRKTTRYLVKKAKEMGVEVKEGKEEKDFKDFLELYQETVRRGGFAPHKALRDEWETLGKEGMARLYSASYQGKTLAAALIIFYGNQAVYHHSGGILGEIPANYGLLWHAISEAKKTGKKYFNFWGIAPQGNLYHPWKGFTLFKTGFGGRAVEYLHAQDLPLSKMYWLTWLIETIRRVKRGY